MAGTDRQQNPDMESCLRRSRPASMYAVSARKQKRRQSHNLNGAEVVFHGLKGGGVSLCSFPVAIRILAHELHCEEAATDNAGIVVRPEFAGSAITIAIDDDSSKIRCFARVIAALDYVLKAEAICLIF